MIVTDIDVNVNSKETVLFVARQTALRKFAKVLNSYEKFSLKLPC